MVYNPLVQVEHLGLVRHEALALALQCFVDCISFALVEAQDAELEASLEQINREVRQSTELSKGSFVSLSWAKDKGWVV